MNKNIPELTIIHNGKTLEFTMPYSEDETYFGNDVLKSFYAHNKHVIVILSDERREATKRLVEDIKHARIMYYREQGEEIEIENDVTRWMDGLVDKLQPIASKGGFLLEASFMLGSAIMKIKEEYAKRIK